MTCRALNAMLQAQLTNMTTIATSRQPVHTLAGHSESPGPSSRHGLRGQTEIDNTDKLVIPHAPDELDHHDYPSARFWTHASWNNHKKNQINQGINPVNLGFLCDEDGTRVSKDRLVAMTKHAKQLWTSCYHLRMDPPTWTKKCDDTAHFFSRNMRISFAEFGLCENDWKVEAFAVIWCPDWASDVQGSGMLTRKSSFILFFSTIYAVFQVNGLQEENERTMTTKKPHLKQRNKKSLRHRCLLTPPSLTLSTMTKNYCHKGNLKVLFQPSLQRSQLQPVNPCCLLFLARHHHLKVQHHPSRYSQR